MLERRARGLQQRYPRRPSRRVSPRSDRPRHGRAPLRAALRRHTPALGEPRGGRARPARVRLARCAGRPRQRHKHRSPGSREPLGARHRRLRGSGGLARRYASDNAAPAPQHVRRRGAGRGGGALPPSPDCLRGAGTRSRPHQRAPPSGLPSASPSHKDIQVTTLPSRSMRARPSLPLQVSCCLGHARLGFLRAPAAQRCGCPARSS